MHRRAVMVVASLLGLLGCLRAWLQGPMWLDESFIPLQYADRLARGEGLLLPGESVAMESFTNPLWVVFNAAFGRLNLHEAELQAVVGPVVYGLFIAFVVWSLCRFHHRWAALLAIGILFSAPVVSAARDGSDGIWLALFSLVAAVGVAEEIETTRPSRLTLAALLILSMSGIFGAVVALGLSGLGMRAGRWGPLKVVVCALVGLTLVRWTVFGTWLPPLLVNAHSGMEALLLMPVLVTTGMMGIALGWTQGVRTHALAWVVVVGMIYAALSGEPDHGFGSALVPAVGAFAVLSAHVVLAHPSRYWAMVFLLATASIDVRQTEAKLDDVAHARMADFLQSRGMGRFLLWRFEPEDAVVVHKPGALGYYSRRPIIDLSGRLKGAISRDAALEQNPVAVVPNRKMVSSEPQRLYLDPPWPPQLEQRYKQYAIQHQKPWQMVEVNPVWFHLYIRRDLPMLRPEIPKSNGNILPPDDPFGIHGGGEVASP